MNTKINYIKKHEVTQSAAFYLACRRYKALKNN